MRTILIGALLLTSSAAASARELVYHGTWLTTNRRLDGEMTCAVTDLGGEKWRGHFHGVWGGREFSYKVEFSGPPEKLQGRAVIDGANYEWTGKMTQGPDGTLKGKFTGDRYFGSFDLKRRVE